MPIRFRCVYCNKLLGIARRKAGAVVNCPQCRQPLIVPTPGPEPETSAASVGTAPNPSKLFERDDFDVLLEGEPTFRATDDSPPQRFAPPSKPFAAERSLSTPASAARPRARAVLNLSRATAILLGVLVVLLLAVAFGGGLLVGRAMHG